MFDLSLCKISSAISLNKKTAKQNFSNRKVNYLIDPFTGFTPELYQTYTGFVPDLYRIYYGFEPVSERLFTAILLKKICKYFVDTSKNRPVTYRVYTGIDPVLTWHRPGNPIFTFYHVTTYEFSP